MPPAPRSALHQWRCWLPIRWTELQFLLELTSMGWMEGRQRGMDWPAKSSMRVRRHCGRSKILGRPPDRMVLRTEMRHQKRKGGAGTVSGGRKITSLFPGSYRRAAGFFPSGNPEKTIARTTWDPIPCRDFSLMGERRRRDKSRLARRAGFAACPLG
jgi:hypothetical protein